MRSELNLSLCASLCARLCKFVIRVGGVLSHTVALKEGYIMNFSVCVCEKCKGEKKRGESLQACGCM